MSFFDNPFAIAATASLIIQILVFGLLIYGYVLKKKLKFRQHGLTMLSAVILHAITIFGVMVPSFVGGFSHPGPGEACRQGCGFYPRPGSVHRARQAIGWH